MRLTEIERTVMKWNLSQYSEEGGVELVAQKLCTPLPTATEVLEYQLKLSKISDDELLTLYKNFLTYTFSTEEIEYNTYKYFRPEILDIIYEGRNNDESFKFMYKRLSQIANIDRGKNFDSD